MGGPHLKGVNHRNDLGVMKTTFRLHIDAAAATALFGLLALGVYTLSPMPSAKARDYKLGALTIEQPWTRATPGGAKVAAGYMTITNQGDTPERLVGGSAAFAERVGIHKMSMDNDVMRMRPLPEGLEIPPGATVELKPGGYHLMFIGLAEPLAEGERRRATLVFDEAGEIEVELTVEGMGEMKGHGSHGHP